MIIVFCNTITPWTAQSTSKAQGSTHMLKNNYSLDPLAVEATN